MAERLLVTGATRGVGRAVAEDALRRDASVIGVYRQAHDAAASLRAQAPERCTTVCADLDSETGIAEVVRAAADTGVTGVVFAAGIAIKGPFDHLGDGVDPLVLQLHADLQAPLLLCRALLRSKAIRDGGAVVFVSSNLARRSIPNAVAYSAAKAGLEGATRALACELGPRGMRVNAVAPGLLRTDMTADRGAVAFAEYAKSVPLGRVGTADDVAPAVAYLLRAAYVTGQVLDVDGGYGA